MQNEYTIHCVVHSMVSQATQYSTAQLYTISTSRQNFRG